MPARNRLSLERAKAPQDRDIVAVIRQFHWELENLTEELQEILPVPAVRYELYPRVRGAMVVYGRGLRGLLAGDPDRVLSDAVARVDLLERRLSPLDRVPWKDAQTKDAAWRKEFLAFRADLVEHCRRLEHEWLGALAKAASPETRRAEGDRFLSALPEADPLAEPATERAPDARWQVSA